MPFRDYSEDIRVSEPTTFWFSAEIMYTVLDSQPTPNHALLSAYRDFASWLCNPRDGANIMTVLGYCSKLVVCVCVYNVPY